MMLGTIIRQLGICTALLGLAACGGMDPEDWSGEERETAASKTCKLSADAIKLEPQSTCSVSSSLANVKLGQTTTITVTVKPNRKVHFVIDPFIKIFLPKGLEVAPEDMYPRNGWGSTHYASSNTWILDNFYLSYDRTWTHSFRATTKKQTGIPVKVKVETWSDYYWNNFQCHLQRRQSSCHN